MREKQKRASTKKNISAFFFFIHELVNASEKN